MKNFLLQKDEGVSALVVAAILVVIAVVLALVFKDQIGALIESIFTGVDEKVNAELGN